MSKKLRFPAVFESVFDLAYLIFAIATGIDLLLSGIGDLPRTLYGAMALVLGCGDAFHLVPRVYGQLYGKMESCRKALGVGKLVTSITMTVFYLLLYTVWLEVYGVIHHTQLTYFLFALAAIRVILCLCPQNRWLSQDPPLRWAVYRNIPFLAIGAIVLILFAITAPLGGPFRFMPMAIALSFAFYLPVVLFSQRCPPVGALMLPKTMMYVWILCMGLAL